MCVVAEEVASWQMSNGSNQSKAMSYVHIANIDKHDESKEQKQTEFLYENKVATGVPLCSSFASMYVYIRTHSRHILLTLWCAFL